ncbi:MAG: hypothetical protein ABI824_09785 [Acidobacteriota bacterium]
MANTIQARLDADEQQILQRLQRELGLSPSQAVREGLKLLNASHPPRQAPRVIGLGKFDSGISDLGSNKKHLEGFGRSPNPVKGKPVKG